MTEIINPSQQRSDSLEGRLTFEQARNRIIGRDEDGIARMLILANGNLFSMKISAEGVDVLTASDDDLIFNSDNNLFKIVDKIKISVSKSANTTGAQNTAALDSDLPEFPVIIASVVPFSGFSGVVQAPYHQFNITGDLIIQCQVVQSGVRTLQATVLTPNISGGLYTEAFTSVFDVYIVRETAILP